MDFHSIKLSVGPVTTLTLDRPDKRNAMSVAMGDEIVRATAVINQASGVRLVLVRGAGRSFSAGGDLEFLDERTRHSEAENRAEMLAFYRRYLSIRKVTAPTVAVLHGAAIGAGMSFAIACDLRLAAREAKLGFGFVRVGLHPGMGTTALLPRLVGPAVAADLMMSGRVATGEEAERVGLVNAAVPRAELEALVEGTVAEITASAPIAVAQTKASLQAPFQDELDAALQREAEAQALDYGTRDVREALAAFAAKRPPEFQGE